jgi:uncharacterized protein DUF6496
MASDHAKRHCPRQCQREIVAKSMAGTGNANNARIAAANRRHLRRVFATKRNQTGNGGVTHHDRRAKVLWRLGFGSKYSGAAAMPRRQSPAQRETVKRVMHEYKHGELKSGGGGRKVKNPRQAVAIALQEAGASKNESPRKNRENLRRTKAKERRGETARDAAEGRRRRTTSGRGRAGGETKAQLYAEAKRRDIPGRSKMDKGQLQRALRRA